MDLPPPPPPLFRHHHHHHDDDHLRYGNVLQPPNFIPPHYTHHLPPPPPPPQPQPRPPHIFLPPPPLPPPSHIAHPPLPHHYTFSPPHHSIERSYRYEIDSPPKPYFHRDLLPPPPPLPPRRENLPSRLIHDYPQRNLVSMDDGFHRVYSDNPFRDLSNNGDRNLQWGGREVSTSVLDIGEPQRHHRRYDDDVRRWDNGTHARVFESRRWDIGSIDRGRELYNERCDDERRWNSSHDDERRWGIGINDGCHEFYHKRDVERGWDIVDDRSREFYSEVDDGEKRRDYGINDGVLLRLGNREQEFPEGELNLGRFSGRLGSGVSKGETIRPTKKRRVQKKNAVNRIQSGKVCSWHSEGYKCQHVSKESSRGSYTHKDREGFEWLDTGMEENREREQSTVELAISFGSNGLVAKAIQAPSLPEVKLEKKLTPRTMNIGKVNSVSGRPSPRSSKDMVKNDPLTHGLDFRSDSQGMSKELLGKSSIFSSGSPTPINTNDLGENAVKDELRKDMKLQGSNNVGSGRTRVRRLRKKRRARKQLLRETCQKMSKDSGEIINANSCINNLSVDPRLNSNIKISKGSVVPDTVLLPSLGGIDSENVDVSGNSYAPFVPNLKRERSSLTTLPASQNVADNVKGPSDVVVPTEGSFSGSIRPQERLLQVEEDKYSDVSSADANSKECCQTQVNIPEIGENAEVLRSADDTSVSDRSNFSSGSATSTNFLPADHKGILAEFDVSFLDISSKKSFYDAVGSPEAVNNVKTSLSIDYSSKNKRKRKARGDPRGVSGSKTNVMLDTISSIGGEVAIVLAQDLISPREVDIPGEKDSSKEDDSLNEEPSGAEELIMNVDTGTDSYSKKRKVISPRRTPSALSEDDSIADSLTKDCSKLDQGSTGVPECEADHRKDIPTPAFVYTNKCGSTDMEGKAGMENYYVADINKTIADDNKHHMNDDLASNSNNLFLCADGNGVSTSSSDDELLAPGLDMPSCMSSPENLLSYSDFGSPRKTEASASQLQDQMICWKDKITNTKPLSANLNAFSVGKSLEKAALHKLRTNAQIPQPQDSSKVVPKSNLVHGKVALCKNQPTFAVPKTFPRHLPINFNSSSRFPSTHATKSRTWHRPGNFSVAATEPRVQPSPLPLSHGPKIARTMPTSYIRKGNSLVRKPSPSGVTPPGLHGLASSVYRRSPTDNLKKSPASDTSNIGTVIDPALLGTKRVNASETAQAMAINHSEKSVNSTACALEEIEKSSAVPECQAGTVSNSDRHSAPEEQISGKKMTYVKRRSYQLVAASDSEDLSVLANTQASSSDGYYKKKKNQLVRSSLENHVKEEANGNTYKLGSPAILLRNSNKRQSGFAKTYRSSKVSFVWKLHDAKSLGKHKNLIGPQKVWPYLFPWKKSTYRRSFMHALGSKPNISSFSTASQKLLLSRKRGAIYTRSTHGYSLRMSKVLSVGGSSLKWSKSIDRNSKKANEEATRAVAAAAMKKKEGKDVVPIVAKSKNHVSRKWVLSLKLRPGERIFRIGSERYKMDPTRRTLHRITAEEEPSSSVPQSEKNVKRSYVPRRLLIGNDEYVRIGNGNQLVRDPKKRTRVLASEKVKWSLRTARLRLARKRKYCQFFTRFGKCNKDDGKCPYIHDPSKIVVCTKFLNGSCSDVNCKLTHKVIPERMQDCSYFLKGSCSNENCPYRHVNVDPDSSVCESFLRGYCAAGNECRKKHTYVCPAFEATGTCPQASTCKLHHPKKKTEKKPTTEQQKIVRGRYFDGGLIGDDCSVATTEKLSAKGKDDIVCHEGDFPDYISLDVSDDIVCQEGNSPDCISLDVRNDEAEQNLVLRQVCEDILPDA
ncbi:hypothetical protein BUALT_Bualt08G0114800 [Buddleja alternifolia]|uniref:C3H1-type domain-containing protein n=1 Tax=Buddleja alternifolia TaxID=168488 RepID=A0AAV6XCS0_9LAMI|nr:hypothetical protein BUALT_Bualt08G0114800 [Buddleja alternifolia]